jgi:hypothetical protein
MELKVAFTESAFGHQIAEDDIRYAIANKIRDKPMNAKHRFASIILHGDSAVLEKELKV